MTYEWLPVAWCLLIDNPSLPVLFDLVRIWTFSVSKKNNATKSNLIFYTISMNSMQVALLLLKWYLKAILFYLLMKARSFDKCIGFIVPGTYPSGGGQWRCLLPVIISWFPDRLPPRGVVSSSKSAIIYYNLNFHYTITKNYSKCE